ncbi:uncharacterized protein Dana_GF20033 [Drosophila ananassae]|uniref:aralkylamine N-acetyltransferase n=1 Tax=Drosophila ananassae TaxID=7217 RepID=B3MV53_DROAN|nr:arylalkylamine N-acetyltransferase-like 2 [Drosophila ananassae]EDV33118.2 uncharacterized protein Dana_GF20033 [Drosophila ananassae]
MLPQTKNGITIRIMTEMDYPKVKLFMKDNFYYDEPMGMGVDEPLHLQNEADEDKNHLNMISQKLCLVATEDTNKGRVVGIVLAERQIPENMEDHRIYAENSEQHLWGQNLRFLSKVERDADLFNRFGVSELLYSYITNVDAKLRGKGLGSRLAAALMDVGRSRGLPLMAAYCTSFYSARQKAALGMECVHSYPFVDFRDKEGHVVFNPPPPHTHVQVMVMRL